MSDVEQEFFVEFQFVTPEWAHTGATPLPWVAYTSAIDGKIGDAYTGLGLPAGTVAPRRQ
jgi:hypothetical protein